MSNVPGLDAAITRVIKAAIAAEMSDYAYYGTCDEGFEGYSRATEELPISDPITVTYPDGQVLQWGSPVDHVQANFVGDYTDATQLYQKWDEEIRQNFERFEDLPTPGSFDHVIDSLEALATALDAGGAYLGGEGSDTRVNVGNLDLAGLIHDALAEVEPRQGDAMESLRASYLNRLSPVVAGQQVLVAGLLVVVKGERTLWRDNAEDLVDMADKAEAAFLKYAGGGGGNSDAKGVFTVLAGLASIASTALGGVPGLAISGAVIGTINGLIPAVPEPEPLPFEGGSTSEVHANLLLALSEQCRVLSNIEQAYAECAELLVADAATTNPVYYDLAVPGTSVPFVDSGPEAEYLGPGETLDVHGPELREAAGNIQAVSLVLNNVANDLPTLSEWPWDRLHYVGYGRYGHHAEALALREQAYSSISRTATTLGDVAEKMVLVSYDFQRTEDQIVTDLTGLVQQVDDPTPGQDVPYGFDTLVTTGP